MKRLAVPLVYQPKNSSECGLACMEMVAKYYLQDTNRNEILKNTTLFNGGIFPQQIGLYFNLRELSTQLVVMNPHVFIKQNARMTQKGIQSIIRKYKPDEKTHDNDSTSQGFMLQYFRNGGRLTPRVPTIEDITSEIDAGRPLIANMTTRWHCGEPAKLNRHYNVITGYDDKRIFTNDPGSKFGGKKEYRHADFFFSVYAVSDYLGCGSLLKIKPKKQA